MQITSDTKNARFCFVGFAAAILAFSADVAAQIPQRSGLSAHRRTPSDFPPDASDGFEHGRTQLTVAERAYAPRLRQHIQSIPFARQKRDAYVSMRLLRKLYEVRKETPQAAYDVLADLKQFPASYVGRPIVLYGKIKRVQRGRGSTTVQLLDLNSSSDSVLANVDVLDTAAVPPQPPSSGYPARLVAYLVKLTDGNTPLMLSPRVEWLHYETLNLNHVVAHKTRGVRDQETDAYYETLMKTRLIKYSAQQKWATKALQTRIEQRWELAQQRHQREREKADSLQATDASKASQLTRVADARLTNEKQLHEKYKVDPANYPLFADIFMNPASFEGKPVTLTGHIRKVMSYDSDFERFGAYGGGKLHELWLYTSDSQQNPAVIICEDLPPDLPTNGSPSEGVTVTGYFFKLYRYAAGDVDRAAPMILAKQVTWSPPTEQHVAGMSSAKSIATLIATLVGGCFLMYLWSNYQSDRRARDAMQMVRAVEAQPEVPPAGQSNLKLQPTLGPTPEAGPIVARTTATARTTSVGTEPIPAAPTVPEPPTTRPSTFESILGSSHTVEPPTHVPVTPVPTQPTDSPGPAASVPSQTDPLARARQELEQSMQRLDDKASSRRERLANAAASISGAASLPTEEAPPAPASPQPAPQTAAQVQPASIIGGSIVRVLQQQDGGSFLELSTGVTLSLANDVVTLTQRPPAGALPKPEFHELAGARVSHLALDQWDRVYLLIDGTVFATEDFEDDGRRCLIYGDLTTLIAEEPDLTLIDYWTRSPLS